MTLEELTDILVTNRYGRRTVLFASRDTGEETFMSDLVTIGINETDQTFYLYARTKPTQKALEKMFAGDSDIIVSFMGKIVAQ